MVFWDAFIQESKITQEMLRQILTDSVKVPDALLGVVAVELNDGFEQYRIKTRNRLNHILVQVFLKLGWNLILTIIVNKHDDHNADRFNNLEMLLYEGMFNEVF